MKIYLLIIVISSLCAYVGYGNTALNSDQTKNMYTQTAILKYFEKTGKLPGSWFDLRQVEESRKSVDVVEGNVKYGKKNDFVERFRFIPGGTTIRIRRGEERVIAMSNQSIRLSPSLDRPKYRLIVIQLPNDGITIRQYTEKQTATLFKQAGFDLADYTGSSGKWQPEPEQAASEDEGEEDSTDVNRISHGDELQQPESGISNEATHQKGGESLSDGIFPMWLLIGIPVLGFIAWMALGSRNKRKI